MSIEHFNFPFKFSTLTKHVDVVDQDSIDDVGNCVMVALSTQFGSRVEVPTFGVPDQVFQLQPLTLETIISSVLEWESRADLVMNQETDIRDPLITKLTTIVSVRRAETSA